MGRYFNGIQEKNQAFNNLLKNSPEEQGREERDANQRYITQQGMNPITRQW
jgi:hypothetical protein